MNSLRKKLDLFINDFPMDEICKCISEKYSIERKNVEQLIETFSNETKVTLNLVESHLSTDKRLLEVGAGLCFFSLFLKKEGYNIVALEPALGGFGVFEKIKDEILQYYSNIGLEVLNIPVEGLNISENGQFDIVFSNNVIEHIPNLDESFSSMKKILSKNAIMLHSCPNYLIPYEPHFGIPVIKHFSDISKTFFKIELKPNFDVWDSLNFITYFDVKRISNKNNLHVIFKKEVLYNSLLRMDQDDIFYKRHSGGGIYRIYSFIKKLKLLILIKYLPPMLSTPMVFSMALKNDKGN
ncbi:MAG: class I SAM-dependent methyltransferase [Gammaproteobacteria bacterium]|nr:class I SAM-dependent methyltransferase [Gammaproteobacteria bacterium]